MDEEYAGLQTRAEDKTHVWLACHVLRLGFHLFHVRLEHEMYPPRTPRNDLYEVIWVKWPIVDGEAIMHWCVLGIPAEDEEAARQIAQECGLVFRMAIPNVLGMWGSEFGVQVFPMDSDQVRTLENTSGHATYFNNPAASEIIRAQHNMQCDEIFRADIRKYRQEMKAKGASDEEIHQAIIQGWGEEYLT